MPLLQVPAGTNALANHPGLSPSADFFARLRFYLSDSRIDSPTQRGAGLKADTARRKSFKRSKRPGPLLGEVLRAFYLEGVLFTPWEDLQLGLRRRPGKKLAGLRALARIFFRLKPTFRREAAHSLSRAMGGCGAGRTTVAAGRVAPYVACKTLSLSPAQRPWATISTLPGAPQSLRRPAKAYPYQGAYASALH